MQELTGLITEAQSAYNTLGWLGALSALLYGGVRIWRLVWVQRLLPASMQWNNWKPWVRLAVVFGTVAIAAFLSAVATGTAWVAALPAALIAGLIAMGARSTEKAVMPKVAGMGLDPNKTSLRVPIKQPDER
jgi:hypothetical protein